MTVEQLSVGDRVQVGITKVVHGGHFLAHYAGKTIFVRGALDGEKVEIEITSKRKKVYFAQTVAVHESSPHRVNPPCTSSFVCGGCDFQYIDVPYQLSLKTQVLRESLQKFSGLSEDCVSQLVAGGVRPVLSARPNGSNWRQRSRFVWNEGWHMRRHASHELVQASDCTIITQDMRVSLRNAESPPQGEYAVVEGENGVFLGNLEHHLSGPSLIVHTAFDTHWSIPPQVFWQADPQVVFEIAAFIDQTIVINPGEQWWDLFGGAGVFAAYLSQHIGQSGRVTSVDADPMAAHAARTALGDRGNVRLIHSDTEEFLDQASGGAQPDLQGAILDPPRAGVGESVTRKLMSFEPTYITYIACDPVALSRDLKTLCEKYRVVDLRAWDAFPMSHHFETVAILKQDLS